LHQHIERRAMLVHCPPKRVFSAVDRNDHFIKVPLVARARAMKRIRRAMPRRNFTAQRGSVAVRKLGKGRAQRIGMLSLRDRRTARRPNYAVHRHSSSALSLACASVG
jgi:hypothetical protein